ncbi:helix-turn-helix domain-containing protein [Lacticaseibacillus suibinensis]|uniref:helix-turn-helix domain-containing protein n=1 Tax=Lacticaseibacillus suibinensis TaxID=2486011 RepID=UPI0019445D9D|nr:helix-turn-helix transcriptional regulator [Lacticaseibacillus suibinensis]
MTIGEQLAQARKTQQMTQQQVADQLHVARQTVSNWEVGRSYPDIASLIALSRLFSLSLDTMLKEDGQMVEDLKKKEAERRNVKMMYWAAYAVSLLLIAMLVMSILHVPGMILPPVAELLLSMVGLINVVVVTGANLRYRQTFQPKSPATRHWPQLVVITAIGLGAMGGALYYYHVPVLALISFGLGTVVIATVLILVITKRRH